MGTVGKTSFVTRVLAACGVLALLAGCGGGAETVQNPVTSGGTPAAYSGPPPATADVQSFKINVWDNLKATNRCGQCHTAGGQAPQFVRQDDINLAYAAANGIVTLGSPRDSRLVTKVAGGHNCWLASSAACADILTTWISNWAGATMSLVHWARNSFTAVLLTTRPLARASSASSIVRTTSSSSSGSSRMRPGSRPDAATASSRNWLSTDRIATARPMPLSRSSPPRQVATT